VGLLACCKQAPELFLTKESAAFDKNRQAGDIASKSRNKNAAPHRWRLGTACVSHVYMCTVQPTLCIAIAANRGL
jgi:hypothetical protein